MTNNRIQVQETIDPFAFGKMEIRHLAIGVLSILFLGLIVLLFLQAALGMVDITTFILVTTIWCILITIVISPYLENIDEPQNRKAKISQLLYHSFISTFSALLILTILFLLRLYFPVFSVLYDAIALGVAIVSTIMLWRNSEVIAKGSTLQGSLSSVTIRTLLFRNVYFCILLSMIFSAYLVNFTPNALNLLGLWPELYFQQVGIMLLLALGPFFLLFLAFVEVPGIAGISTDKRVRRYKLNSEIAALENKQDLDVKEMIRFQRIVNELVTIELSSDHPFPILAKVLGGGLLALLITVLLALII